MARSKRILGTALLTACITAMSMFQAPGEAKAQELGVTWTGNEWNGSIDGEKNCNIVSIGRESARVDSIPYDTQEQAVTSAREYQKELSPYYQLLSQCDWKFSYYESHSDFEASDQTAFFEKGYDDSDWDEIFVPSVWQTEGYDHPIYTNSTQKFARNFGNNDIGFPRDLPKAPTVYNPIGLYRHSFVIPKDWEGQRVYLDFEGVDSACYVWVNGVQVGYAEDSFTTNEFDITDYVSFGEENVLAVKVYRWCDGSWLEDQDYFDLSGIFRDVYLYAAPQVRVRDFAVVTDFDESFTDSTLNVTVDVRNYTESTQDVEVSLKLLDAEENEVFSDVSSKESIGGSSDAELTFEIPVKSPRKWSAEDPYLYTLVIEEKSNQTTVYEAYQVGFRKITYKQTASGWYEGNTDDQDLICINGQPISFRGVDRHETHPEYGYAITREVMEEDIRIMLENNINSVRTSHYPNNPYWYYLCDKYGIYVVDEANVECHSNMLYENERITEYMSRSIIDREYNMVRRDRNHASVVMWSLGNECKNPEILRTILVQEYEDPEGVLRVLHEYTKERPWHYEQAGEMYETGIDVYSGMYERVEALAEHGESDVAAPMIECEYEHAMGNSEGNFDEYWEAFDTYRNLQGGFIWDFVDQSIYLETEDGTKYFGYGGDYGERIHDENFCANGLLLPDRTVQPEMAEVKYHYQQVKFSNFDPENQTVELRNYFLFTDISEKYQMTWCLQRDETIISCGPIDPEQIRVSCIDPQTNQPGVGVVTIPYDKSLLSKDGEYFINIYMVLKETDGLLPKGHEIAKDQFLVGSVKNADEATAFEDYKADGQEDAEAQTKAAGLASTTDLGLVLDDKLNVASDDDTAESKVRYSENEKAVSVETDQIKVTFDKELGILTGMETVAADGTLRKILEGSGIEGNFFRAATDNDRSFNGGQSIMIAQWKDRGDLSVSEFSLQQQEDGSVKVIIDGIYESINGLRMTQQYLVTPQSTISAVIEFYPNYDEKRYTYLPLAGLKMELSSELENLTWFGNGPEETYSDRYKGTTVRVWYSTVSDNFFPYIRSSETGNHVGIRWLSLTDKNGFGVKIKTTDAPFEFSALHYTAEELDRAVHPYELERLENVMLHLNVQQMGVGGDDGWSRDLTHEQYLLKDEIYTLQFEISVLDPA